MPLAVELGISLNCLEFNMLKKLIQKLKGGSKISLYNMVNGVNKICVFFVLPMLNKHPDKYPRFRDCFLKDKEHPEYDNHIHIYTRVGGNNRNCGYGEEELYKDKNFVTTFDDNFDDTYASYIFKVPEKWKEDFEKIKNGKLKDISEDYINQICSIFPKISKKIKKTIKETVK
jgi:hypothetical protein